jgi:hypothetical protein
MTIVPPPKSLIYDTRYRPTDPESISESTKMWDTCPFVHVDGKVCVGRPFRSVLLGMLVDVQRDHRSGQLQQFQESFGTAVISFES